MHIGQVVKWQKILVSNIFYHFLFTVSLGNRVSNISEKFGLHRKIGFQNTFYAKCFNVIIDSIGPSIILRSIYRLARTLTALSLSLSLSLSHTHTHTHARARARNPTLVAAYVL